MDAGQVWLFDDTDLNLDGRQQDHERGQGQRVGLIRAMPAAKTSMAAKMGLRTQPNTPVRTKVVVSPGSTPIRQDSPMPCWA